MSFSTLQKLVAEAVGTGLLLAIIVGSGIMGAALVGGNDALALLANSLATGAGLVVLITIFAPVSGAHFNPAVTLAFVLHRQISPGLASAYASVQLIGAVAGVALAHAMFDLEIIQTSLTPRAGGGQLLSEGVASFGLVLTILSTICFRPKNVAMNVGLFIAAGYWFTASTGFANPAVTFARSLTDTFAGIRLADAPAFALSQLTGAVVAATFAAWLFQNRPRQRRSRGGGAPRDEKTGPRYRLMNEAGTAPTISNAR